MEAKLDSDQILTKAVGLTALTLTNAEIVELNMAMQLEKDPRGKKGYEKAKGLFTATKEVKDPFTHEITTIPVAHEVVKEVFAQITLKRLPPP